MESCPDDYDEFDENPITDQQVGPPDGTIRCTFNVLKIKYVNHRHRVGDRKTWLVRANTMQAFQDTLWGLIRPHLKRAILIEHKPDKTIVAKWGDKPTIERIMHFTTFSNKVTKSNLSWNSLTQHNLAQWDAIQQEVCLTLNKYSKYVKLKAEFDIAHKTLIAPKQRSEAAAGPSRAKRAAPVKVKRTIPGAVDGYNFRQEVRGLRETFLEMRDLMHVLDNRLSLLEEKCEGQLQDIKEEWIDEDDDE